MNMLKTLKSLETRLHETASRSDQQFMNAILHKDFMEIGRSGRNYSRDEILAEFAADASLPEISASEFQLCHLAEAVWLLTYRTALIDDNGALHRHSLRSSIWLQTESGLQLRFHQGTATEPSTDQAARIHSHEQR